MRSHCLRLCSAALVFVVLPGLIAAQKSAPDPYAGESMVLERADVVYAMNADGTGYMQKTVAVKLQSAAALQQVGIIGMEFAANSQHVEFHYVRVRRPDGSVTETPVSDVIEQPLQATVQAPFYSDLKMAQVPVKNLQVGDTLEWEGRVVMTKPEAPNEFWGVENFVTEGSVVREQSVELRAPVTKAVTVWTNPALNIQVKESKQGGEKIYHWESSALKPTVGPEADATKEAKKKHVLTADEEVDQEQGKLPSVAWTTFPSWAAVGEWYRGLVANRTAPDDEIKAKVAELTAGKTTEEEKVRAIYAYVSTQIRYIGVAFGVGRYQPHEAVDVLHNQYGDCKDKATLLAAMLAAAGVPSDEALIGAGIRFNEAVPSPASFNHLITHLKIDGKDVWLDSTEEVAPYRMMYAGLRDRETLVIPPTGPVTLGRTPAEAPFAAFQTWTAKGTLDANGISESHITLTTRGDDALVFRSAMRQIGPAQYDEVAQRAVNGMGYAGTTSHAEFSRSENTDKPYVFSFDYHREKAGDWDNLRIIPQLAPIMLPSVDDKNPPVATINLGEPRTETSTAEIKLPAGWKAELPEAVHEKAPFATYDESYRFENGTLHSERKLVVLQQKILAQDWKAYKKWTDTIGLGNETYVQLIKAEDVALSNALRAEAPAVPAQPKSDPTAALLIRKALSALRNQDLKTAASLLQQAKTINAEQEGLWSGYASLALQEGHKPAAAQYMLVEVQNHPDSDSYCQAASAMLRAIGDLHQSEKVLRIWSDQHPTNPLPLIQLAGTLLDEKQPAEAAATAQKAWLMLTDDGRELHPELQLTLGLAQMRSGMQEQGVSTLTNLLKASDNPMAINNAAYALADAGKALSLDEEKQRMALAILTKRAEGLTLEDNKNKTRTTTSSLVDAWNTMGWILFREGKTKEAKTYIEAALANKPDAESKAHLHQVDAALAVHQSTPHAQQKDADIALRASPTEQSLRTISLGAANGRHGVAEYRLLLWHGRLINAEPAGEKRIARADDMMKRADFSHYFPAGSNAKLVRGAMLNCSFNNCQLVLLPLAAQLPQADFFVLR